MPSSTVPVLAGQAREREAGASCRPKSKDAVELRSPCRASSHVHQRQAGQHPACPGRTDQGAQAHGAT
jgi:hypothetical protein